MTKLKYPKDGIKKEILNDLKDTNTYLTEGRHKCNFNIPYNFPYRQYLLNLNNKINTYQKNIENIIDNLYQIEQNYNACVQDQINNNKRLEEKPIKERERLII